MRAILHIMNGAATALLLMIFGTILFFATAKLDASLSEETSKLLIAFIVIYILIKIPLEILWKRNKAALNPEETDVKSVATIKKVIWFAEGLLIVAFIVTSYLWKHDRISRRPMDGHIILVILSLLLMAVIVIGFIIEKRKKKVVGEFRSIFKDLTPFRLLLLLFLFLFLLAALISWINIFQGTTEKREAGNKRTSVIDSVLGNLFWLLIFGTYTAYISKWETRGGRKAWRFLTVAQALVVLITLLGILIWVSNPEGQISGYSTPGEPGSLAGPVGVISLGIGPVLVGMGLLFLIVFVIADLVRKPVGDENKG